VVALYFKSPQKWHKIIIKSYFSFLLGTFSEEKIVSAQYNKSENRNKNGSNKKATEEVKEKKAHNNSLPSRWKWLRMSVVCCCCSGGKKCHKIQTGNFM
jgi:hypothetical protein